MARKTENSDPVTEYARNVVNRKTSACKLVKLACQRHLRLLKTGLRDGVYYDRNKAVHAIKFFNFLRHLRGEWAGCTFRLEPFQQFIVGYMFGWYRADGTRMVRTAYLEIPRKNGKTTLAAGIGLYLLAADGEPGAEVYCAATKRDQAKLVFDTAREMVRRSPALKNRLTILQNSLSDAKTYSRFLPLGADKDTLDGLNIHGAIIDELHAHKDRGVWDVLVTSTAARKQPMIIATTTAGLGGKPTICREQRDYAERVLRGVVNDLGYFAFISTIDEGDNWADEKIWKKVNPGLGTIKRWDIIRQDFQRAKENPAFEYTFRRYHLNEWVQQQTRWLSLDQWDASAGLVNPQKLEGKYCYAGLDLANKIDIAAMALLFPEDNGKYVVLPIFWVPEATVAERSARDRVPYDVWVRQGYIRTTPGEVIDYAAIKSDIIKLGKIYRFQRIGYDPWSAWQMAQELEYEGYEMIEVRPGMRTMTEPTKELSRLVAEKKLVHGGNPVLRWMASNLVVKHGPTDLLMPDKAKSADKIDGIMALITAIYLAMRFGASDNISLEGGVHFL